MNRCKLLIAVMLFGLIGLTCANISSAATVSTSVGMHWNPGAF